MSGRRVHFRGGHGGTVFREEAEAGPVDAGRLLGWVLVAVLVLAFLVALAAAILATIL